MDLIQSLLRASDTKMLMLILDGLGGLPDPETGRTELETANAPNLDRWAREGATGLPSGLHRGEVVVSGVEDPSISATVRVEVQISNL